MSILVFDVETTGIPSIDCRDWSTARIVQIAWLKVDTRNDVSYTESFIIKDDSYKSCDEAVAVHGITEEIRNMNGVDASKVLNIFIEAGSDVDLIVFHSGIFDIGVIKNECELRGINLSPLYDKRIFNTKRSELYMQMKPTNLVDCVAKWDPEYKPPSDLGPHDALYDTYLCFRLYQLSKTTQKRTVKSTMDYIDKVIAGTYQTRLT